MKIHWTNLVWLRRVRTPAVALLFAFHSPRERRRSVDQHAAVHVDGSAGDVGRQIGGQEQTGVADVIDDAEARERDALDDLGPQVIGKLVALMSVWMRPGVIEFTRTLSGPSS